MLECKTEGRNNQREHGQPMEQTSDSGDARCLSQHQ